MDAPSARKMVVSRKTSALESALGVPRKVLQLAYYSLYTWSMGAMYLLPIPSYIRMFGIRLWSYVAWVAVVARVVPRDWSVNIHEELLQFSAFAQPLGPILHASRWLVGGDRFAERLVHAVLRASTNYLPDHGGWPNDKEVHKVFAPLSAAEYADAGAACQALHELLLTNQMASALHRSPALSMPDPDGDCALARRIGEATLASQSPRVFYVSETPRTRVAVINGKWLPLARPNSADGGEEEELKVAKEMCSPGEELGDQQRVFVSDQEQAQLTPGDTFERDFWGKDSDASSFFSLNSRFEVMSPSVRSSMEFPRSSQRSSMEGDMRAWPEQQEEVPAPVNSGASVKIGDIAGDRSSSENSGSSPRAMSSECLQRPRARATVSPDETPNVWEDRFMMSPDWDGGTLGSGSEEEDDWEATSGYARVLSSGSNNN